MLDDMAPTSGRVIDVGDLPNVDGIAVAVIGDVDGDGLNVVVLTRSFSRFAEGSLFGASANTPAYGRSFAELPTDVANPIALADLVVPPSVFESMAFADMTPAGDVDADGVDGWLSMIC